MARRTRIERRKVGRSQEKRSSKRLESFLDGPVKPDHDEEKEDGGQSPPY
jgi:hypothetical protein